MKKAALLFLSVVVLAITVSACKTHERCPAYGDSGSIENVSDKV